MAAYGTTTQQWAVLGPLSRPPALEPGITVKELIEFLMLSRQNLAACSTACSGPASWSGRGSPSTDASAAFGSRSKGRQTWAKMLVSIQAYYGAVFSTEETLTLFRLLDRLRIGLSRL